MLFDAHCHLDMYKNPETNIRKSQKQNIFIVGMTLKPSHFKMILPFLYNYKNIRFALGMHPLFAHEHSSFELDLFKDYINKTSYIGEIGLDFSKTGAKTRDIQISCFQTILELLQDKKKFVSLHSRKAEKEVLFMLNENNIQKAIFHWFTGSKKILEEIIERGHYFSINHAMAKTKSGRNLIKAIPIERVLTETDGPYQKYNGKDITPIDVGFLYEELEEIYQVPREKIERIIMSNFLRIISDKIV